MDMVLAFFALVECVLLVAAFQAWQHSEAERKRLVRRINDLIKRYYEKPESTCERLGCPSWRNGMCSEPGPFCYYNS